MTTAPVPALQIIPQVTLTASQFQGLAAIPPELEWFVNLPNPNTQRAWVAGKSFENQVNLQNQPGLSPIPS
jgi:hypothetical protein